MVLYFTTTLNNRCNTNRSNGTMLRLTHTRQFKVSNRTAVLAALFLVVSTVASLGDPLETQKGSQPTLATTERSVPAAEAQPNRVNTATARKKGFKVSLYLFRRS